jgi:hypothetical protein
MEELHWKLLFAEQGRRINVQGASHGPGDRQ